MPGFNGSGTFVRTYNWQNDAAADIKIRADRMDTEDDGFATGLSTCITKDGQTTITANLPMAGFIHTGVGAATARTHYARTDQLQDGSVNWVDGGGTADAITATYSIPLTALVDGQLCFVRATAANATTTPTFSPNSLTARTIVKNGNAALVAGDIAGDGHELVLRYRLSDTKWELLNPATANVPAGSIPFSALDPDFIDDVTSASILTTDNVIFGDASDSGNTKKDTVANLLALAGGVVVGFQVLTSSGTYTPTTGATKGVAVAIGGGGGGGGADGTTSQGGSGCGGGGGGCAVALFSISGTVSYTIGAAGTAGSAAGGNGGNGGTTTLTGIAVATGGNGGTGSGSTGSARGYNQGPSSGIGTTGALLLSGQDGAGAKWQYSTGEYQGGDGGSAPFGGGGGIGAVASITGTGNVAVAGTDGGNYGGGGGGASVHTDASGAAGGAGAAGVIYILEYK